MTQKQYKKYSLYNRAWRVVVIPANKFSSDYGITYRPEDAIVLSDSSYGEAALRCKFRVESSYKIPVYSDVTVYNLSEKLTAQLATEGGQVVIEAGYKNGVFAKIWQGYIFSFQEYRENVVDKILVIHCINGRDIVRDNFIVANLSFGQTLNDRISFITKQIKVETKSSAAMASRLEKTTRGYSIFGSPYVAIKNEAAITPGVVVYNEDEKITIVDVVTEVNSGSEIVVSPESGLIGIPEQVPEGVSFKTFLDPRIQFKAPPQAIKLENSLTKTLPQTYGREPPLLDSEGRYKVVSVIHTGDTRGNDWYSSVEAVVNPEMRAVMAPGATAVSVPSTVK